MAKLQGGTRIYGTANVDTTLYVNSTASINTTGVYTTGVVNASSHSVGTNFTVNTSQLAISGITVSANGSLGTATQVLTSNSTGGVFWGTGVSGYAGSQGNLGYAGSQGYYGSVGYVGSAGSNGYAGSVGYVGSASTVAGYAGSAGVGYTGSAGSGGGGGGGYTGSVGFTGSAGVFSASSYFNGATGNYLTAPANAVFNFGTSDFTVECWAYFNDLSDYRTLMALYPSSGGVTGAGYWTLQHIITTNKMGFYYDGSSVITGTTTLTTGTWYHFAMVRSGTTVTAYVNGVSQGTATFSGTVGRSDNTVYVGAPQNISTARMNGYISNVRLVKGVAVYTGAFTPSTAPLTPTQASGTNIAAITGTSTSLLTCQSLSILDASPQSLSITNVGSVLPNTTYNPFPATNVTVAATSLTSVRQQFVGDGTTTSFSVAGGYTPSAVSVFLNGVMLRNGTEVTVTNGATVVFAFAPPNGALIDVIGTVPTAYSSITPQVYSTSFNGTSQSLSTPANAAFQFGSNNFTVEMWINFSSVASGQRIAGQDNNSTTDTWAFYTNSAGTLNYFLSSTGNSWNLASGTLAGSVTTGTWYHIALVRNGSTFTPYINGVAGTTTTSASALYVSASPLLIGAATGGSYFNGYISNYRMVNGVAVYTNNFTVPTSPLQSVQSASGAFIQAITGTQTSLLTCNGPTIIDGSTNAFTITNNGSAPVSTSVVPTFTNVTINNTSGSGGLSLAATQTSNVTATAGYIYPINTSSGPVYVTLPASPTAGQQVAILDYAGIASSNNITIYPNGNKLNSLTSNTFLSANRESVALVYVDSVQGWVPYSGFSSNPFGYNASYLVVAGGGGGGAGPGGGGGAGGLITSTTTLTTGTVYSVTVGAGGAASPGSWPQNVGVSGLNGANSVFGSITAIGGGGGGGTGVGVGTAGGSGGGSNSPGNASGTSGQGNAGGSGISSAGDGGGGGGASAVGSNSGSNGPGGAGGAGLSSSITGTSVTYAGGGGGGGNSGATSTGGGAGGVGGGGAGGYSSSTAATAGTTNLGGGGGGGGRVAASTNYSGAAGGSGVVIISVPTANYTGITTGSPTVTTYGNFTIVKFTSSGSYTA